MLMSRWEHIRDLYIPAGRKEMNPYSSVNLPDFAAVFLANATRWAFYKESGVDRDATRLRGEAPRVRPLVFGSVLSRFAHFQAIILRIATIAADPLGHIRSVLIKAVIERAIHTTCTCSQTILHCSLLSLDQETPSASFPAGVSCGVGRESRLASYYPVGCDDIFT
jgi:hypothetical protein